MDSMINRYTADRKIRSDDAYTPGAEAAPPRPRRHRLQPALPRGLQGRAHRAGRHRRVSLRRIAHYDYWSDKVRRSIVVDAKCDLLLYGNAERALVEMAHRLARREPVERITDVRGTAFMRRPGDPSTEGWFELDSTEVDQPGRWRRTSTPTRPPASRPPARGQLWRAEILRFR
jgi:radical SAM superfamily enzyme YgiQ (UPF0313 family)